MSSEWGYLFTEETDIVPFGKYKGVTIGEMIRDDPNYTAWCMDHVQRFELSNYLDYLWQERISEINEYYDTEEE